MTDRPADPTLFEAEPRPSWQGGPPDPISLREGERRRDVGTSLVMEHADDLWKAAFEREGVAMLRAGRTQLTSEDITGVVGLPPGHPNVIGAVMRAFAVRHNMRNIGTVKSARVARHAGRVTVWERL